jgi:hypothetical protein
MVTLRNDRAATGTRPEGRVLAAAGVNRLSRLALSAPGTVARRPSPVARRPSVRLLYAGTRARGHPGVHAAPAAARHPSGAAPGTPGPAEAGTPPPARSASSVSVDWSSTCPVPVNSNWCSSPDAPPMPVSARMPPSTPRR